MIENDEAELPRAVEALNQIGLPTHIQDGATGFIEGVRIVNGELYVAPGARVSGLLHEAGHVAVAPKRFRHFISDNVDVAIARMFEAVENEHPDSPLHRAVLQCSDAEATAWAYAFGTQLGYSPEFIIRDDEYDGEGAFTRLSLTLRSYLGINGLAAAGFCTPSPVVAARHKRPLYPQLAFWTQEL
jgi:hypothetical protein